MLRPLGIEDIVPCHDLKPQQYVPGVSRDGHPTPLDASRSAYAGDGGLCGSAAALATWLDRAFVEHGDGPSRYSRLLRPVLLSNGVKVPYGYGVSTRPFLDRNLVWHGGNVDSHSSMIALLPEQDLRIVMLFAKGFIWPTDLLPALVDSAPRQRVASAGEPPEGHYRDGLFNYQITPDGSSLQVEIDLLGPLRLVPVGPGEYVAENQPATFLLRLAAGDDCDCFEFDWGEVRSYARRVAD